MWRGDICRAQGMYAAPPSGVTILWWQGGTGNATLFQWRRTYEFCTSVDVVTEVLTDRPPCGATVAVSGPGIGRGRLAAVGQTWTAKNPTQNDCR